MLKKIEEAVKTILTTFGLSLEDLNLVDTPKRVAKVYQELLKGHNGSVEDKINEILSKQFPSSYGGIVAKKGIKSYALCPHHLLPVEMEIDIGYIPNETVIGISKLIRIVKARSRRLVLQEDLTEEIANNLFTGLNCKGVIVIIRGKHFCERMRGIRSDTITITSSAKGLFLTEQAVKEEFLKLWKIKGLEDLFL